MKVHVGFFSALNSWPFKMSWVHGGAGEDMGMPGYLPAQDAHDGQLWLWVSKLLWDLSFPGGSLKDVGLRTPSGSTQW